LEQQRQKIDMLEHDKQEALSDQKASERKYAAAVGRWKKSRLQAIEMEKNWKQQLQVCQRDQLCHDAEVRALRESVSMASFELEQRRVMRAQEAFSHKKCLDENARKAEAAQFRCSDLQKESLQLQQMIYKLRTARAAEVETFKSVHMAVDLLSSLEIEAMVKETICLRRSQLLGI
jgi:hypothetical protein